jgi:hypothetical protein
LGYLDGKVKLEANDPNQFLTMHEVGPYDTASRTAMKQVARIIRALALSSADDLKDEKKPRQPQACRVQKKAKERKLLRVGVLEGL